MGNTRVDFPALSISRGTTRRCFLTWTAAVSAAAFTPAMLGGNAEAQSSLPEGSLAAGSVRLDNPFALGVASGDPLPYSVILWTRLAPKPLEIGGGMPPVAIPVDWEIATDEASGKVVNSGTAIADPADAHSVHLDVKGLETWRVYYYRFRAAGAESPVGRTRTSAPLGADLGSLSFAWASCQTWHDGYYNAYEDMAEIENDVIFFLGDYIYESEIKDNGIRDVSALSSDVRAEPYTLD